MWCVISRAARLTTVGWHLHWALGKHWPSGWMRVESLPNACQHSGLCLNQALPEVKCVCVWERQEACHIYHVWRSMSAVHWNPQDGRLLIHRIINIPESLCLCLTHSVALTALFLLACLRNSSTGTTGESVMAGNKPDKEISAPLNAFSK